MPGSDDARLRHMLDAGRDIQHFTRGRTREDLGHDRQLRFAVVKCLEIIGEAAGQVSEETRNAVPELPWPQIVGMRNRMVHGYYEINLDIVWATVERNIPPLVESLDKHLGRGEAY